MALEHLAITKSFARRHGYVIGESQELVFLGLSNFANGFSPTMPTGGAFSRTAMNSESGVKSPLGGLVTSGFVVLSIYFLTGTLFWIHKATLSAIIVTAVWQIIVPPKVFYSYYRTSLVDFVASMISFWTTLFVSVEVGIAAAITFSILHLLLRTVFARLTYVTGSNIAVLYPPTSPTYPPSAAPLPHDTQIFKFTQSLLFPNAYRTKAKLLTAVQVVSSGSDVTSTQPDKERLWSKKTKKIPRRISKSYAPKPAFTTDLQASESRSSISRT